MKLLLYTHFFAPSVGGVETIVLSLARGLAELRTVDNRPRFELTVVAKTPAGDFDDSSLPFRVVRNPGLLALKRLIDAADVIHLAGPALVPLFLVWFGRKRFVVEHHGYQSICPNGLLVHQPDGSICPGHFQARRYEKCVRCQTAEMPWFRSIEKVLLMFPRNLLARSADCNIAVSRHLADRIALPKSRVIYHGVENTSQFDTTLEEIPPIPGKLCFAFVGRLVPEKGLPVLLQAAEILKQEEREFELLLIGDGPQRKQLEAMIARSGLSEGVHILGFLEGPTFAETLARVHVVVLPSVWEETAGLAAMEHMMRSKLVIASKIGGLPETIGDTGLACLPGSADDLARCMREVLTDRSLVTTLGRQSGERARSAFLRQRMIADHVGVYREISGQDT